MKKYIIGVITGLILGGLAYAGITACGGSQNYCITTDGTVNAMKLKIAFDELNLPSLAPDVGSFIGVNANQLTSTSATKTKAGLLIEPKVDVTGMGCTGCDIHGFDVQPLMTNATGNGSTPTIGIGLFPGLTNPAATTITQYYNTTSSWYDLDNLGTITNFVWFQIDSLGFKTGVTNLGTVSNFWGIKVGGTSTATGGDIANMKNNLPGVLVVGIDTTSTTNAPTTSIVIQGIAFGAGLPAAPNGTMFYCSDCDPANCTAGASTGSFCKRQNGAWLPM